MHTLDDFREEKSVHDHHRKKIFWGTFLASKRKTFQAGGGYKKPYKNQESHIYHRNLSSVAPVFFRQRKVPHWSRAAHAFFFPVIWLGLIPQSKSITQLIPRKSVRAMISRISRNPARNNSSEIFWESAKVSHKRAFALVTPESRS